MLLDHRTYTVRVGTLRKQLALYEKTASKCRSAISVSRWRGW